MYEAEISVVWSVLVTIVGLVLIIQGAVGIRKDKSK